MYCMMGRLSETELVFLRCCMDRTLFTKNARAHWQEGISDRVLGVVLWAGTITVAGCILGLLIAMLLCLIGF